MKSMRMKWRGVSGAASAGVLAAAALAGGCSSIECKPYGCDFGASLKGSIVVTKEVPVVDLRFCVENKCDEGSIALAESSGQMPCAILSPTGSRVCLSKTNEPDSFALHAESSLWPKWNTA